MTKAGRKLYRNAFDSGKALKVQWVILAEASCFKILNPNIHLMSIQHRYPKHMHLLDYNAWCKKESVQPDWQTARAALNVLTGWILETNDENI